MSRPISRRHFLSAACRCGAAVAAGGAALSLTGCREEVESASSVLRRVRGLHKQLGGLPPNPVAVVQTGRHVMYPNIGRPLDYDRPNNPCYPMVEEALMMLNPEDPENPLSNVVHPGDTVAIKPNWCSQYIFPIPITHPSLVHAAAELAARAGAAKVRIIEAPMTMTHSATWFYGASFLNVKPWLEHLSRKHPQTVFEHIDANADAFTWVRLGDRSLLTGKPRDHLYHDNGPVQDDMFYDVPDSRGYDPRGYEIGLYAIANGYLDCDVWINFAKLKTHMWSCLTAALKNTMGLSLISTVHRMPPKRLKEYFARADLAKVREAGMRDVPHFDGTRFTPEQRFLGAPTNDILWRSLGDLTRIMLYCDKQGKLHDTRRRRQMNVVDGIVGTDHDGPVIDARVHSRTIVAGEDPVRVDAACARVMGYEPTAIPLIRNSGEGGFDLPVGRLAGYEESIVSSSFPKGLLEVHPYQPPGVWADDENIHLWHKTT